VKQAIFTNLNDAIELTISTQTLVGRTSPGRGPAELILASYPLYLLDRTLRIDWTDVEELLTRVSYLETRVAALEQLIIDPDSFLNIGFYPDAASLPMPPDAPPGVTVLAYDDGANKL